MPFRLRLLKGATALLYVGPMFAGISGMGLGVLSPFVAIFLVWLLVLRPEQWPSTPDEWLTPAALGAVLTLLLSQILLVCVLLGIGRGIGAAAGFLPVVNPLFPLAVSFVAIPLCRVLWDARAAANEGVFLDDAAEAAEAPRALAEAGAAIVPLLNLADNAPDADVNAAMSRAMTAMGASLRLDALVAALARPSRSHAALRRALVLWSSEPEIVASGAVPSGMANAFAITGGDGDLLRLYVPRALALIAAFPDRAADFPSAAQLRRAATDAGSDPASDLPAHLRADLRDGLTALARAVEHAQIGASLQATSPAEPALGTFARTA